MKVVLISGKQGSILIPFGRKNVGKILMSDLEGEWFGGSGLYSRTKEPRFEDLL